MLSGLRAHILPPHQRRTLDELTAELDPAEGDVGAKRSAFWTLLVLSAVIATAGVLSDSTATVIGAMIIAPLSTPIMGVALAVVRRRGFDAIVTVVLGAAVVVLIGLVFAALLPGFYNLHTNSQVTSRTSPGILDLVVALATGSAGAIALARRDVAAVLPGVAIAISLVPPLAVVGVCLGSSDPGMAAGAALLFLSNVVSMIVAGTLVFTVLVYDDLVAQAGRPSHRARLLLATLLVGVTVPLVASSAYSALNSVRIGRVQQAAQAWIADTPGAEVTGVVLQSSTYHVEVRTPDGVPPVDGLLTRLQSQVPAGTSIVVDTTDGEQIDAGEVGGSGG